MPLKGVVVPTARQHQREQPAPVPPDDEQRPVLAPGRILLVGHPGPDDLPGVREPVQVRGVLQLRGLFDGMDFVNRAVRRPWLLSKIMHQRTLSGEDPGLSRFTWVSFGGMTSAVAVLTVLLVASLCALVLLWHSRSPRDFGSPAERAVFEAFHTASLAAPPLRAGLTPVAPRTAARHLRVLFGGDGLALTDCERLLAFDGAAEHHPPWTLDHARPAFATARMLVAAPEAPA